MHLFKHIINTLVTLILIYRQFMHIFQKNCTTLLHNHKTIYTFATANDNKAGY